MKEQEFQNFLEERQGRPLFHFSDGITLPKYQHIERLGNTEVEGLLDGEVYVQNKIDGSNLTVAKDPERGIVIASRNQVVSVGGDPPNGFNGAVEYVLKNEGIRNLLEGDQDWVLRGEWLVKHAVNYAPENFGHFYVFDVQRKDGSYIPYSDYVEHLIPHDIKYIPMLEELSNPTVESLTVLVHGPDEFGAKQKEGIVIKRYDFINKYGRVTWAKLVSDDFKETHKMIWGASKKEDAEIRFASHYITREFVLKTILKIKEQHGDVTIRQMPEVLGRVWYDAFQEELWNFVKNEKVTDFNFRDARRLAEKLIREYALEYFNGITSAI